MPNERIVARPSVVRRVHSEEPIRPLSFDDILRQVESVSVEPARVIESMSVAPPLLWYQGPTPDDDDLESMFDDSEYDDCEDDDYEDGYKSQYDIVLSVFDKLGMLNVPLPTYPREEFITMKTEYGQKVSHRRNWIFERIEREGFERRRLSKFSLDDLLERVGKRPNHHLNTETSKFYDWKLGGTQYIIRLEHIQQEEHDLLVCYYIFAPTSQVFRKDLRFWNGEKFELIEEKVAKYSY